LEPLDMALCYVYDFESLSSIARRYGVSRSLVSEREEDLRRLELIDEGLRSGGGRSLTTRFRSGCE
jgi:hypothetical protein